MHGYGVLGREGRTDYPLQGVLFRLPPLLAIAGAPILAAACPVALATRLARLRSLALQHERLAGTLVHRVILHCNSWQCPQEYTTNLRTTPQRALDTRLVCASVKLRGTPLLLELGKAMVVLRRHP